MSIIRVRFDQGGWCAIPNATLNDRRLRLDALGLLAWLLSKPDGWEVRPRALELEFLAGRDKIRGLLKNMEEAGYLRRSKFRDPAGRWDWVSEVFPVSTIDVFSVDGSAVDGLTVAGKSGHIVKTEKIKTEVIKKEKGQVAVDNSFQHSILALSRKLGVAPRPGESWDQFSARVRAHA